MKRKTGKKKFAKKCKEAHRWIADMRTLELPQIIKKVNRMPVGYYHYYGITDDSRKLRGFCCQIRRSLFYWLNRRSQKMRRNSNRQMNLLNSVSQEMC